MQEESTINIPYNFKYKVFSSLNMGTNKKVHLMDGFTAVYKRDTFKNLTKKLAKHKFKNFSLLRGGYNTDKDQDMILNYDYGKENSVKVILEFFAKNKRILQCN